MSAQYSKKPKMKADIQIRKCLVCRDEFVSEHFGERICKRCKETQGYKNARVNLA